MVAAGEAAYRGRVVLAYSKWMIRWLDLDMNERNDLDLMQFQSLLFNRTLEHLSRTWKARAPNMEDSYFVAAQVLKGKRGYDLWRGPTYERVASFFRLLWQVAAALIKQRGGT